MTSRQDIDQDKNVRRFVSPLTKSTQRGGNFAGGVDKRREGKNLLD